MRCATSTLRRAVLLLVLTLACLGCASWVVCCVVFGLRQQRSGAVIVDATPVDAAAKQGQDDA